MDAYDDLYAYTMGRKNFILQHVVDANIAQRAPAANPPHIGVVFALVGLYLHVEKRFTGTQVQNAHRVMGGAKRSWPDVIWPVQRGCMTAADVLSVAAGPARDEAIDEWCTQVWAAFLANRTMVVDLLGQYEVV